MKECVKVCPYCDFLMFCDDKNLPYGTKPREQLQKITIKNLKEIQKFFDFDIIIFACNTLSCTVLETARQEFEDKIFIGTVPAIKPALEHFEPKDVLVLATPTTIEHNYLINKNKGLIKKPMIDLAEKIDQNIDNLEGLKDFLTEELKFLNPKAIVLGCTHYVACKKLLNEIFPNAQIFDSANGVAHRLLSFVGEGSEKNCQVQIMTSDNHDLLGKFWWYYLNG